MKQKLFTLLLAVAASVGTMFAVTIVTIDGIAYNLNEVEQTAEVTSKDPVYSGQVVIPSSVTYNDQTYSVTRIGYRAFSDCSGLTSVTIPNSVTSIGNYALSGCSRLTSIEIPNSVTSIGNYALSGCYGLTAIDVAIDNLNYCSLDGVLYNKDKTTLIQYPKAKTDAVFVVPNSVTSIGNEAFAACKCMTNVTIPNSVTSIGNEAFANVLNVVYNGSATGSPWGARSVNGYVEGWLAYGDDSKQNLLACSLIATGEITVPNSVTNIGNYAFQSCDGLTSVTIPNSVTSIGRLAFNCGLTSITIPNSVTSIGNDAFYGVLNIIYSGTATGSPWGARSVNGYVEGWLAYSNENKTKVVACAVSASGEMVIPTGVKNIEAYAFSDCRRITAISIPPSVTTIGSKAFTNCTGLISVNISDIAVWCAINFGDYKANPMFYTTKICLNGEIVEDLVIPDGVTSIGNYAFDGGRNLTSVNIPNTVTSIGVSAFYGCGRLTSIINNATTPQIINSSVFDGDGTFFPAINKSACVLYVPKESIDLYKVEDVWKDFTHILPIEAEEVGVTTTTVITTDSTANVAWPEVENAYTYELIIRDSNGNIICSLVFDSTGRLLSITFHAPSKDRAPQQTQTAGFAFTVNGLTSGTTYNYELTAKDSGGNILNTETGTFTTQGNAPTAIDEIVSSSLQGGDRGRLILRDGQILILRGNKTYTLSGQEVK